MKILEGNNKIEIAELDFFNPEHIFKCGQAFRWIEEEDGSYTNVAHNKIINVSKGENIVIDNSSLEDFQSIWMDYFDLNRDYGALREELSLDETLKNAMEYGSGIRILNQDPFETIITFIISANNQIPRIKNSVAKISEMYGSKIGSYGGREYYSFPSSDELSRAKVEDLREFARVGFRDERIVKTSKLISEGAVDLNSLYEIPLEDARRELMKLPGVGPKVADCVLLFAFKRSESFPVDVWIKRVMEELYLKKDTNKNLIADEGRRIFGKNAGFAQQYLFYYGRENNLGR
ncbi:N-glycosylase/DNA lyase [Anaerosphaera aminiphila DSM 21120]|uniref:DNA-(apurinic or apyrimidinic site) lyase n=1 Tax=Anaerosphaera aminiphila DSM 21120 TaxID=1120995 RepID=A0A1M5QAY5_9FIRM|nr:DNA glycosylase [Anaerosphaera aminiphila]SHH11202.1 N-glycosylase/DNA lyase [Anaerosphaera aminiphila DSM 21120]